MQSSPTASSSSSSVVSSSDDEYEEIITYAKKRNADVYHLPEIYHRRATAAVRDLVSSLELQLNNHEELTGNRPLSENSKSAYGKHFNGRFT